jgi:HK97 family phage portal protein
MSRLERWLAPPKMPGVTGNLEHRQSTLADGPQWLIDAWGGSQTIAGERINQDSSLAISDVFAAVDLIAETISQLPLKVFRDITLSLRPGTGVIEDPTHRCWRILHDMPNPFTPAHRFWSTITVHHLLWGNWFIEKLRGSDGLVNELRILHPSMVEVEFSELAGVKRFIVTRQDGMRQEPFGDDRILHGFGLSKNGLIGMSRIQQAREMLGVAKGRKRWEGEVYQRPFISGVVKTPMPIKDGGVKLRESWKNIYGQGSKDRGGIAVLEEGAEYQQISAPLEDMQFVENAQLSKTEIAVLFKLPPSMLGGSTGDSLTYATVEGNKIQLATSAIAPVANSIAQFLSHDFGLFPFQSWYCEFVMEGMLRGDSAARADYWSKMKPVLNLDPEYIAARENIPLTAVKEPEPVPIPLSDSEDIMGEDAVSRRQA